MKIKIEKITRQEGMGQKGPWTRLAVRNQLDGKWYSSFLRAGFNDGWTEGAEIDVEVEANGKYLNIVPPKKQAPQASTEALEAIQRKLDEILLFLQRNISINQAAASFVGDNEEIPF